MATRNIVPRATGEGSICTPEKKWNSANIKNINAESIDIDNIDVTNLDVTNLDVTNLDVHSESVSPVNTLQRETTYAADDIVYTSKLNAKYYLLCITGGTTGSVEPSFVGAESNTQITDGTVVWRVQTATSQEKAAGVPVGFEYFQMNPNVPEGSLPLLGGVYSRDTYKDLWAWVQLQGGYLKTEAEWQTLSTANNGNVPFYSSGDGSTTFRVPSLHCWIKGSDGSAQLVGSYLQAGLPNIEGEVGIFDMIVSVPCASGAFSEYTPQPTGAAITPSGTAGINASTRIFKASNSNSIYGNANTVQPESIVGMWLVKCYGTVADTGTIDEKAYMDEQLALNVPVGCVQAYAGQITPQGWLLCDGSAISRTQYNKLFGVIGTSYGAGDGTDTFNLPDLTDKFIQGNATSGTEHGAGLPNITGHCFPRSNNATSGFPAIISDTYGAFSHMYTIENYCFGANPVSDGVAYPYGIDFDASRSSSIYGASDTVQPPSVTMRYIIKY
jgi:microcystin-dependent protein